MAQQAAHLSQFFDSALFTPNPTANPHIHEWRVPSSKGKHARTPGSTNRLTDSAFMARPPGGVCRQLPQKSMAPKAPRSNFPPVAMRSGKVRFGSSRIPPPPKGSGGRHLLTVPPGDGGDPWRVRGGGGNFYIGPRPSCHQGLACGCGSDWLFVRDRPHHPSDSPPRTCAADISGGMFGWHACSREGERGCQPLF